MNKKRFLIGLLLISISIILVFPKSNLSFLNWGKDVKMVLFAFIPVILIGYGILLYKKNKPRTSNGSIVRNDEGNQAGKEFGTNEQWESSNNWKDEGSDVWQGAIKNDHFEMKEDVNTSHFAKKLKHLNIESIKVDIDLPEDAEAFIELGSGNNEKYIGKLNTEKLEESEKIELEDGVNRIKNDLNWKDHSFFKIVVHREDVDSKGAIINSVSFEGKTMENRVKDNMRNDERRKENTGEIDEEEMPAFEDVEYKDLECPECGEDFKTDIGLKVHRKVNHPDEFEKNPDPYGEKD